MVSIAYSLARDDPEANGKGGRLLYQLKRVIYPKITVDLFDSHPSLWRIDHLSPIDDLLNSQKGRLIPLLQFINSNKRVKSREECLRILILGLDYQ